MQHPFKLAVILALFASVIIFLAGVKSDLSLGDETFHYRMAKEIYDSGKRPLYDPLFDSYGDVRVPYVNEPLWHYGLAYLWKLLGAPSVIIAQAYQAVFYFLLIIVTYMVALEMYGRREALYSALIVGTVPMITSLSIILHIDVPIALFSTLCFLLLIKKRFFWAGVAFGVMFLTKRNSYFLIIPYILILFQLSEGKAGEKAKSLVTFVATALVINLPDFIFRVRHFPLKFFYQFPALPPLPQYTVKDLEVSFYDQASIIQHPLNILKYLGLVLLLSIGVYIAKRSYSKKDGLLLFPIASYIVFFIIFFREGLIIRYLSPIVPMMAILSSVGLSSLKARWVRHLVVALALAQLVGSAYYVHDNRKIPQSIKAGYDYVRQHIPENAHLLSSKNRLVYYTNRYVLWYSYLSVREMPYLFWKANETEAIDILRKYEISYLFVEKDIVYDDSKTRHLGGYPKTFIQKISTFSRFEPVFENEGVSILRIDGDTDSGISHAK